MRTATVRRCGRSRRRTTRAASRRVPRSTSGASSASSTRRSGRASVPGMADRDLVWSSDGGDLRKAKPSAQIAGGERVKVRREVAGRRGKAVTTVSGVPLDDAGLRELAGKLKKRCGVGGSAKNGVIELQGDHRDVVMKVLRDEGYDPVLAGG